MRNAAPERGTWDSVPYLFSILFRSKLFVIGLTWINIVAVKPIYAFQMTVREPTLLGAKLAATFLCAAPSLLHVSPAKIVRPLAEPAITSNTALILPALRRR